MKIKNIDDYREILENENLLLHAEGFGGEACKRTIRDISYNSIISGEGTLFICKGRNFKGEYLTDALKKGAAGYDVLCCIVFTRLLDARSRAWRRARTVDPV